MGYNAPPSRPLAAVLNIKSAAGRYLFTPPTEHRLWADLHLEALGWAFVVLTAVLPIFLAWPR